MWTFFIIVLPIVFFAIFANGKVVEVVEQKISSVNIFKEEIPVPKYPPLDKEDYDRRLYALANMPSPSDLSIEEGASSPEKNTEKGVPVQTKNLWPVNLPYPKDGAILPFYRVVAYYGNLYSRQMGVLGEYDEAEMLSRLEKEVKRWEEADPNTPVKPALHYIAIVAQGSPGKDGKYKAVMPDLQIDKVLKMAEKINAIVFLDLQVGLSNLETELPKFEKYLKMENVHLGIDPEFAMQYSGKKPGSVIGTFDAANINFAIDYLKKIVEENDLYPKILVVHRFTQRMVTNYQDIKPTPEVQVVMNMDGWGGKPNKLNTYRQFIYKEPVQFTGFKLFYKNDTKESGSLLLTPEEILSLTPKPVYIQYQ